ncbi:L-aminoadipate-semialdehyde dehydrogenase-phosphopantetheinyl transferase [Esox lucius]|uniref:L-aminoadipate-semialdehyde dehydrogenase-phosphopantetheinyl transferase n=1 Tax=Esox lucius TaxID=8010 RepID=A0A3P8ZYA3_ESOLU|nr:L-aminoadipate-semialdehyde dehydrogenase-phosphopantetheinyl transferase [Esox lucius]
MGGVRWAFRGGSWTPTRSEWLLASRCVQREERERIGQFMFSKDAKSAMAGRLLLRRLVCEKIGVPWADFHLERTPRGKPYLASPEAGGWSFNLSHQGDYTVLAAEQGLLVGVDVMKTTMPGSSSVPQFFQIMTRQFTEREWSVIRSAGSEWEQLTMFYRHWALKESFIKAIGTGLGFNLQRAEFHLTEEPLTEGKVCNGTRMHLDEELEEGWVFEESLLDRDHHVAVALGPGVESALSPAILCPSPSFTLLSFSDLISMATPILEEDSSYWESFQKKAEAPKRQSDMHR